MRSWIKMNIKWKQFHISWLISCESVGVLWGGTWEWKLSYTWCARRASLQCESSCVYWNRAVGKQKAFPQPLRAKGFHLVWVIWWLQGECWAKAFPHLLHAWGFPPMCWIFMCWHKLNLEQKVFPHSLHLKGFSPVWIQLCWTKPEWKEKDFPHLLHS